MRTIVTIVSAVIMIFGLLPERGYAQATATARVTATVIPCTSIEIKKSNPASIKEDASSLTLNLRGTGNILVVVNSREMKSVNIHQLTTEKPTTILIPSSSQASKTSITYLSS